MKIFLAVVFLVAFSLTGCARGPGAILQPDESGSYNASSEFEENVYVSEITITDRVFQGIIEEEDRSDIEKVYLDSLKNYGYLGNKNARYQLQIVVKELIYYPLPQEYSFWALRRSTWVRSSTAYVKLKLQLRDSLTDTEIAVVGTNSKYTYNKNFATPENMGRSALPVALRKSVLEMLNFIKENEAKIEIGKVKT